MAGLPARYVEGYLAEPNEKGEALVTGLNAHAWTEVYFSGFGWLTFDATPGGHSSGSGSNSGKQNPPASAPTPEPTQTPTPEPTDSPTADPEASGPPETPDMNPKTTHEPDEVSSEVPPEEPSVEPKPPEEIPDSSADRIDNPSQFPWWLLLAAALLIGCGFRILIISPVFREKRAKTEEKKFDLWAYATECLLRAEKLERRDGETIMAFAHRVDATALFSESVTPAAECLCLIRYSKRHPLESDTGLMRDTALLLRSEISKGARFRYLIRRFFTAEIHASMKLRK
jgi:hypothetical protein